VVIFYSQHSCSLVILDALQTHAMSNNHSIAV
jgi:hypothetical protein